MNYPTDIRTKPHDLVHSIHSRAKYRGWRKTEELNKDKEGDYGSLCLPALNAFWDGDFYYFQVVWWKLQT